MPIIIYIAFGLRSSILYFSLVLSTTNAMKARILAIKRSMEEAFIGVMVFFPAISGRVYDFLNLLIMATQIRLSIKSFFPPQIIPICYHFSITDILGKAISQD